MKNNMTVWQWNANPGYYLKKPWKWVQELWWNIQAAHHRATKGYCYMDWANFGEWFKAIAPKMLRDIADKGIGYPGVEPFDEPEKWHDWLHRMADQIEATIDDDHDNEYWEPFEKLIDEAMEKNDGDFFTINDPETKDIRNKYYERSIELMREHDKQFKETMLELFEHWGRLYD